MTRAVKARAATAIRFDPEIYEALIASSEDHDRPVNWLVNEACRYYLERLLPAREVRMTRDGAEPAATEAGS